jgi:hypothetical protein
MRTLLPGALTVWMGAACLLAASDYTVTLNTKPLENHAAGPFSLYFQLTDGSGGGDGNTTITLSNFQFSGGSSAGAATATGGGSGSLDDGITLTDTAFINDVRQPFSPGDTLTFTLHIDASVDQGDTPDQFTFWILDSSGAEIPTVAFSEMGADMLIAFNANSSDAAVETFAADASLGPIAGGGPIGMDPPVVAPAAGSVAPAAKVHPASKGSGRSRRRH